MAIGKKVKPWNAAPVLRTEAEKHVKLVSNRIKQKKRRKRTSTKGGTAGTTSIGKGGGTVGAPGGSLSARILEPDIIAEGRNRITIKYTLLGQTFLWLRRGTVRQRKHAIRLQPKRKDLRDAVEADAFAHFQARDRKEAPRG